MKRFSLTLVLSLLMFCPAMLHAQDRPTHPDLFDNYEFNGSFNRDNHLHTDYYTTEYTWVSSSNSNGLTDGGKLTIGDNANNYNYMHFFQCNGHNPGSTNQSKRFLIANGFGGNKDQYHLTNNTPSNKKIIQYRVQNVQPNVLYDLQFWAVHLSDGENSMVPGYHARVDFRIQCNGSNVTTTSGDTHWEPQHTLGSVQFFCKPKSAPK